MKFNHESKRVQDAIVEGGGEKYRTAVLAAWKGEGKHISQIIETVVDQVRDEFIGTDDEMSPYEMNLVAASFALGESYGVAKLRAMVVEAMNKVGMMHKRMGMLSQLLDDGLKDVIPVGDGDKSGHECDNCGACGKDKDDDD